MSLSFQSGSVSEPPTQTNIPEVQPDRRGAPGSPGSTSGVEKPASEAAPEPAPAAEQLAEVSQRLQAHMENSPLAVIEFDPEFRIKAWNTEAQRVFGWTAGEVLGRKISELHWVHEEDAGRVAELSRQILEGAVCRNLHRNRNYRKDGRLIHCEWYNSALRNRSGGLESILSFVLDVSDTVSAREALARRGEQLEEVIEERTARLREMVDELEHFSYSITHDMRAPLRAMTGYAQLMMEHECAACAQSVARDFLRRIATAARRMDLLITDALNYSRIVSSEPALRRVDVRKLLGEMLRTYPQYHPSLAQIRVEEPFPPVLANEAGLTQCFSNLLDNAIKFVAPNTRPEIRIRAEEDGKFVRVWVEDNGIGIAEEFQGRAFGMFQRFDKSYEGTGIGLAIVRKNMERMQGEVSLCSQPGKGSRFCLRLVKAT